MNTTDENRLTLDSKDAVYFYEQEFYVLSNFSAFRVEWCATDFDTAEHAYHWAKFDTPGEAGLGVQRLILMARSAHEAFKLAQEYKALRLVDWDKRKHNVMYSILIAKLQQHEYVKRKLIETGERTLIENSWRDDFWGWGPNRDGQNRLGQIWMQIRYDLQVAAAKVS